MSPALELPIALRKVIRSHHLNPKYVRVLNYAYLSTLYLSFVSALDVVSIHKSTSEAMNDPNWRKVKVEEIVALNSNNSGDIITLPPNQTIV